MPPRKANAAGQETPTADQLPSASEALAALQAAQAAWGVAQTAYESGLEQAQASVVARWQKLPRNAGKAAELLLALLRTVADAGVVPDDADPTLVNYADEFLLERQALAGVRDQAKSEYDVAVARHKAQGRLRSVASRQRELDQLREVYPDFQPLQDGEGAEAQITKLSGLLEHTVIAQRLLSRVEELAANVEELGARMVSLEETAANAKAVAARPAWASKMKRVDADLLLAAHAGNFDAAEAALAAGASVNCTNQVRVLLHSNLELSLTSHSSWRLRCMLWLGCATTSRTRRATTWPWLRCSYPRVVTSH